MTDGNIERANQAPTVGQVVAATKTGCVPGFSEFGGIALLERNRTTPERLHASAKHPKANDQRMDCCDDEKAGSIRNGNESKASIEPTLDSEYSR